MQSFDTKNQDPKRENSARQRLSLGRVEDFPLGSCKTVELPEGLELGIYNVDGEFHAIGNFCPHKGAPLTEGALCGHIIECGLHGWQFDVRTGECLTVNDKVERYEVVVEDGIVKVVIH
jgi:nitrite reductase (NADH) small subunit